MKTFVTPFRVGLLVLAAVGFLLAFLLFVRRGTMGADTITVYAMFRDASGLGTRSRVQVAGIAVGEIREISLVGTRARLTLRLRKDIGLRTDATLIKRTESFLGDYLLDLQVGSPGAPFMPDGGEITHVIDQQGLQALFDTLGKITTDIQSVTTSLRESLGGDAGTESLEDDRPEPDRAVAVGERHRAALEPEHRGDSGERAGRHRLDAERHRG